MTYKHGVLQWVISVFLSPLSVRRWTRYLCCWLLCFILAMYISRLWQMPIQRSLLTYSCWREVSVTSTWCHQHMWDWKEWEYFPTTLSMGMETHTCTCTAGVSVFQAFPRLPHYTTHPCVPVTSDIRETVNKWHQLLNGKEPSVVLEMWCHGWRCQRWDSGLLLLPLSLVNRFCSEIRWWLISASFTDRWMSQ